MEHLEAILAMEHIAPCRTDMATKNHPVAAEKSILRGQPP